MTTGLSWVYGLKMDSRRVLIVEDESTVADVVVRAFEREGYTCSVSSDGHSGLDQARRSHPHLIVLDRGLPGFSGDEVLRELKRDKTTASIPVIVLTGRADESDQLVGFALGADDYVCKPFYPRVLLARAESLLRRKPEKPEVVQPLPMAAVRLDRARSQARVGKKAVSLSKVEYRILAALMAARGHVLDGDTLIELALGENGGTSESRVEPHIIALQKKLGPASKCIQEVRGAGYAYCSPEMLPPAR